MAEVIKVSFYRSYATNDPRWGSEEKVDVPSGVFLSFSLVVRADISWPGDRQMADYARNQIMKCRRSGLFDDGNLRSLHAGLWDCTFVHCVVEVDTMHYGQELFDRVTSGSDRVVDIYLYDGYKLIDKLD